MTILKTVLKSPLCSLRDIKIALSFLSPTESGTVNYGAILKSLNSDDDDERYERYLSLKKAGRDPQSIYEILSEDIQIKKNDYVCFRIRYTDSYRNRFWISNDLKTLYKYESKKTSNNYGLWVQISQSEFISYVNRQLDSALVKQETYEVISALREMSGVKESEGFDLFDNSFLTKSNLVAFNNGVLDLETMKIRDFDPGDYLRAKISRNWRDTKKDPEYVLKQIKFLSGKNPDIESMLHMIIYMSISNIPLDFKRCLALFISRKGNSGRSTLFRLIERFVGGTKCSTLNNIGDLSSRFCASSIINSRAIFVPDATSTIHTKSHGCALLKGISGGDKVLVERKGVDPISARIKAMFFVSTNNETIFSGVDQAFDQRILLIRTNLSFTEEEQAEWKRSHGEKKMLGDSELNAYLKWLRDKYGFNMNELGVQIEKLASNGCFASELQNLKIESDSTSQFLFDGDYDIWNQSRIDQFLEDNTEKTIRDLTGSVVTLKDLYGEYKSFVNDYSSGKPQSYKAFRSTFIGTFGRGELEINDRAFLPGVFLR